MDSCLVATQSNTRRSKKERPVWAEAIRLRRVQLDLKQEDVEALSGDLITQSTVSNIELGKLHPSDISVQRVGGLLMALRWTPNEFVEATGINLPGFADYKPNALERTELSLDVFEYFPILGSASAGTGDGEPLDMGEVTALRKSILRKRGAAPERVMALKVDGTCLISDGARFGEKSISPGDTVFVYLDGKAGTNDLACFWDESEGQLILKYVSETMPANPSQVMLFDAQGGRYLRDIDDLTYRGVVINRESFY